jgi:23S rRNA (pseudouridine1915-N3)-methyltransferase
MLGIHLVVTGERMPSWVDAGFAEYSKRIRGRMTLRLIEVPAIRRGKGADLARVASEEERRLDAAIPAGCRRIALDRGGKPVSTLDIVARMERWLQDGEQAALVVGGPEGLSPGFINGADECWSLSALTFAHPVVRVVLAEQVYRCWSVLEGLPYHR